MGILGCFPFNQNFKKMGNSGKQYRNFPEKFPEIPEIVEFPKYQNFKFQEKNFQNLGIPSCEVVLSLYTGVVSSFFSFLPCAGGQ